MDSQVRRQKRTVLRHRVRGLWNTLMSDEKMMKTEHVWEGWWKRPYINHEANYGLRT
jgi:hypothetical protein